MTILIPAYEPDNKLLGLIQCIREKCNYKIVIIDDGSGSKFDNVFNAAKELGCKVIRHIPNMGKGFALKTGFKYIIQSGEKDGVACADCDGQHKIQDILKVAQRIDTDKDSIILGARLFKGNVPFRSLFGNSVTKVVFKMATGQAVNDTQTGLRAYPAKMLDWLCKIKGDRFEYELNILLEAKKEGIGLKEEVIETVYLENNKSSHFRPIMDSIRIYLPIIKFGISSVSSGIFDFLLLMLFHNITGNLLLSVVAARFMSSTFNFLTNKNYVFDDKDTKGTLYSAIKYFSLVILILGCNYFLIYSLNEVANIPLIISKVLTEAVLFLFSYTVQSRIIFKKKTKNI